jgi:ubiquinol-cytochrome c reductase cytochrome b subunit
MFRGLYYGSYLDPRRLLWSTGVVILLLMIVTAFLGYVLPWGQMSFWAATVITNLFSAIPYFGQSIVVWLWGGFSVGKATLTRFFSLHFLFPFILLALVAVHIIILHESGSNNPIGVHHYKISEVSFTPHFTLKDFFGMNLFFIFFGLFVFFMPNKLGHPDNFIEANPMITPSHIVPEWYFLPFYAILRSIPDKLTGVLILFFAIVALLLVPIFFSTSSVRSLNFHPISKYLFWTIIVDVFILGWIGSCPVEFPYVFLGQIFTVYYFLYFLIIAPFCFVIEAFFWNYEFNIK